MDDDRVTRRLASIDAKLALAGEKLNVLARTLGGDRLVREWEQAEADAGVPVRQRAFPRARVRRAQV